MKPALALSLHSTKPELRAALLPRAPRIDPAELVALGERYARATGYPIQYQWTLLEGINDGDDELDGIVALLAGKYAMMNMIPYNAVDGQIASPQACGFAASQPPEGARPALGRPGGGPVFRRPSWERAVAIARSLGRRGILTRLRRSAGQDVEAGCGQLRARSLADVAVTAPA